MLKRDQHRQRWTGDEDDRLRRLFAGGAFTGDVAQALGRSQEAVRTRAELLGISVRSAPRLRGARPGADTAPRQRDAAIHRGGPRL